MVRQFDILGKVESCYNSQTLEVGDWTLSLEYYVYVAHAHTLVLGLIYAPNWVRKSIATALKSAHWNPIDISPIATTFIAMSMHMHLHTVSLEREHTGTH